MLQQILQDMYIDPDLLEELDEEQKQILFCKMREEQVRRWKENDLKMTKESIKKEKKKTKKKPGGRRIQFLLGEDGQEWVWVMGDHKADKPIEQIVEEEAQAKANSQAEQEAEQLRKAKEAELQRKLEEEQRKLHEEQKAQEEALRKKAEETTSFQSNKIPELALQLLENEKKKQEDEEKRKLSEVNAQVEVRRKTSLSDIDKVKEKRSSQIYSTFLESRQKLTKDAEQNSKQLDEAWQKQEKMAKSVEAELRAIARRAREDYRKSLSTKTESQVFNVFLSSLEAVRTDKENQKPALPKKPIRGRPSKPPNREAVVKWFRDTEEPKGAVYTAGTHQVAPWFHGLISRQEAEELMEERAAGTFLVRLSEKVWGYAISYKGLGRFKHFLIDASNPDTYRFFGTNQIAHPSLAAVIEYHETKPISQMGKELLLEPCGQTRSPPDYLPILAGIVSESSYL